MTLSVDAMDWLDRCVGPRRGRPVGARRRLDVVGLRVFPAGLDLQQAAEIRARRMALIS